MTARRRRKERQLIDGMEWMECCLGDEGDETRRRGCRYPTPPCVLAKILPETSVRA